MSQPEGESGDGSTPVKSSASSEPPNVLNGLNLNDLIVETKDMTFTYDNKKGNLLDKINLTFPRGAIYGFLGPSGCGKTTVIKLIIGQLKPVSGYIRVNGKSVKDPSNKIPGVGVGYMPQDYALYMDLTIKETLNYYSRIYGLPTDYKNKRIDFLVKFLELPDINRMSTVLSGGQKRRTSLAVALIHNPKLLILDEPTVGVDPMLRERIWQHLIYLSHNEKTSIMITTHYIDECQRAHVIALIRGGHLLVENTPKVLLQHFNTKNLEDVFLEVCRGEEQETRPNHPPILAEIKKSIPVTKQKKSEVKNGNEGFNSSFCKRYMALLQKNITKLYRQKLYFFVLIITPLIATTIMGLTFGKKPYNLKIAVYNEEEGLRGPGSKNIYSEALIRKIDKNILNLEYFKSNESALDSVRDGKTFGALIVHKNFSEALFIRLIDPNFAVSDNEIQFSTIQFFADTTDLMIYQAMFQTLMAAEMNFKIEMVSNLTTLLKGSSGTNTRALDPIVKFVDPPLYGSLNPEFLDFAAPGLLILVVYLFSMTATSLDIVGERLEGTLDRTFVAGVKLFEMIFAQISVQFFVLIVQTVSILFLSLYVFEIKNNGNLGLVMAIMLMQGLQGMAFGLFFSSISSDELMALELCVGIFLPLLLISGVIWPVEGMHYILRTVSLFTPQTLPILSLRNIMLKGWGLEHTLVWSGFVASFGFFALFIVLSTIVSSFVKL